MSPARLTMLAVAAVLALPAAAQAKERVLTLYSPAIQTNPHVHDTHYRQLDPTGKGAPARAGKLLVRGRVHHGPRRGAPERARLRALHDARVAQAVRDRQPASQRRGARVAADRHGHEPREAPEARVRADPRLLHPREARA